MIKLLRALALLCVATLPAFAADVSVGYVQGPGGYYKPADRSGPYAIDSNGAFSLLGGAASAADVSTSGTITARDVATATASGQDNVSIITGAPTANSTFNLTLGTRSTTRVQVSGTWTGTLTAEGSLDGGVTYVAQPARIVGTNYTRASITANAQLSFDASGLTNLRIRSTAVMTGTANLVALSSATDGVVNVLNAMRLVDNTSGFLLAIRSDGSLMPPTTTTAPTETLVTLAATGGGTLVTTTATVIAVELQCDATSAIGISVGGSQPASIAASPLVIPTASYPLYTFPVAPRSMAIYYYNSGAAQVCRVRQYAQ